MPTFTPPVSDGNSLAGAENDPLMRFYGAWAQGDAVWKDQNGVWHQSRAPYQGGAINVVTDRGVVTTTGPDEGLATAQEVYLGGHTYTITDAKATELMAAGFVVSGHWDAEETRWVNFCISSVNSREYKGGDSAASVLLADGRSLWVFADTFIGSVTSDGFYNPVLPTRNALMVREANGTLSQAFPEGNPPAWTDPSPGLHWWPIDLINDGTGTSGSNYVMCWEVNGSLPSNFGHLLRNEILGLSIFSTVATTEELETPTSTFFIQAIHKDDAAGFHYILGLEFNNEQGGYDNYHLPTKSYTRLARCPIGSLGSLNSNIRYWNGHTQTWGTDPVVPRLEDGRGNVIEGNTDITKVGDTWVMLVQSTRNSDLTMLTAPSVTGPWAKFHDTGDVGLAPPGGTPISPSSYAFYLPKFHEELNPNAAHLVATYNRNIFTTIGQAGNPALSNLHCKTFVPQFIYLPSPE